MNYYCIYCRAKHAHPIVSCRICKRDPSKPSIPATDLQKIYAQEVNNKLSNEAMRDFYDESKGVK